jgi:hypothetical protein
MSHVASFDAVVDELPADWSFFEAYVALDDPARLNEARVALARANGRPLYGPGDHDFAITIANTQGRGARVGVVRSALQLLDDLRITGRTWAGQATILTRPAPAHRYGP